MREGLGQPTHLGLFSFFFFFEGEDDMSVNLSFKKKIGDASFSFSNFDYHKWMKSWQPTPIGKKTKTLMNSKHPFFVSK
jgi:hypothetical protein